MKGEDREGVKWRILPDRPLYGSDQIFLISLRSQLSHSKAWQRFIRNRPTPYLVDAQSGMSEMFLIGWRLPVDGSRFLTPLEALGR